MKKNFNYWFKKLYPALALVAFAMLAGTDDLKGVIGGVMTIATIWYVIVLWQKLDQE